MIIYGKNVVKDYLENNKKIYSIKLANNFDDEEIFELIKKRNINVEKIDIKKINNIESGNHQGIIADVEEYSYIDINEIYDNINSNTLIVILDHIEDTHNFGAIIRTCEAAGVDYIVIPNDRAVKVNSTVIKTSAGSINNIKIAAVANINNVINKLKENGVWIAGTTLGNGEEYTQIDYNIPIAIVLGNEGKGISKLTGDLCDFLIKIPMYGKINSLNVSVATGIVIYEIIRQRKQVLNEQTRENI